MFARVRAVTSPDLEQSDNSSNKIFKEDVQAIKLKAAWLLKNDSHGEFATQQLFLERSQKVSQEVTQPERSWDHAQ